MWHSHYDGYYNISGFAIRVVVALWAILAALLLWRTPASSNMNDAVLQQLIDARMQGDETRFNTIKFLNGVTDEDLEIYRIGTWTTSFPTESNQTSEVSPTSE